MKRKRFLAFFLVLTMALSTIMPYSSWVTAEAASTFALNLSAVKTAAATAQVSWNQVPGASGYDVQFKRDGRDWKDDSDYTSGTSYTSTDMLNLVYYFRVRARFSTSSSEWVEIWVNISDGSVSSNNGNNTITIHDSGDEGNNGNNGNTGDTGNNGSKLEAPKLIGLKSEYTSSDTIRFTWSPCRNATHYWVYIYKAGSQDIYRSFSELTTTSISMSLPAGEYEVMPQSQNCNASDPDHPGWWQYSNGVRTKFKVVKGSYVMRTQPPETDSVYYYSSENRFSTGECTWYAFGRAYELSGERLDINGDACQWYYNYKASHPDRVSKEKEYNTAKIGAIICYAGDEKNKSGHVAVVEEVASNGYPAKISEAGRTRNGVGERGQQLKSYAGAIYRTGEDALFYYGEPNYYGEFIGYIYVSADYITPTPTPAPVLEAPKLKDVKKLYSSNESITLNWDPAQNATHYWIYIYKAGSSEIFKQFGELTSTSLSFTLPEGDYEILPQSQNCNASDPDYPGWWQYANGDRVSFKVGQCGIDHTKYSPAPGSNFETKKINGKWTAVCKTCGAEYPITEKTDCENQIFYGVGKYKVVIDSVNICETPYDKDAKDTIKKGAEVVAQAYAFNAYGNYWLKIGNGQWVCSEYTNSSGNNVSQLVKITPTPMPTPTSTPIPKPTVTPTATPVPVATSTPTPTTKPTPTPISKPTSSPMFTPTPTPTATPAPTVTLTPTSIPVKPEPTKAEPTKPVTTPTPSIAVSPTPTPQESMTVTPTPELTVTPSICNHVNKEFSIEEISDNWIVVCDECGEEIKLGEINRNDHGTYKISKSTNLCEIPYNVSSVSKIKKNKKVTVLGSVVNAYGNKWLYTLDGYWIVAKKAKKEISICTHAKYKTVRMLDGSYNAICKKCGKVYEIGKLDQSYTGAYFVKKNSATLGTAPYKEAATQKIAVGSTVKVIGAVKNAYGNLWYKTEDGYWIYSGNF